MLRSFLNTLTCFVAGHGNSEATIFFGVGVTQQRHVCSRCLKTTSIVTKPAPSYPRPLNNRL